MTKVKTDVLVLEGEVTEDLPGNDFRVQIHDPERSIIAGLSGKMRKHHIRVLPGDRVMVEVSIYDLNRGRITFRYMPGRN